MKTLKQFKDEQMKDANFMKEYEKIQPEMDAVRISVDAQSPQDVAQNVSASDLESE